MRSLDCRFSPSPICSPVESNIEESMSYCRHRKVSVHSAASFDLSSERSSLDSIPDDHERTTALSAKS
jgi:hypothetical protein